MPTHFVVTLANNNAKCAYAGLPKRSMPEAFRSAMERASDEFLSYGVDHRGSWDVLFETARNRHLYSFRPRLSLATDDVQGIQVQITRQQVGF